MDPDHYRGGESMSHTSYNQMTPRQLAVLLFEARQALERMQNYIREEFPEAADSFFESEAKRRVEEIHAQLRKTW
jgi:hypothetical protein